MVDTWAWLAINHEGDHDHEVAKLANEELLKKGYIYVTTNFILAETYTLLRRKVYPQRAVEFGREIQQVIEARAMELVRITPEMEQEAWEMFERHVDVKDLSYTDCTTFAAMRQLGLRESFTNDEHFPMMGFTRLP
jgi:predicted nucleic acid-binding protein